MQRDDAILVALSYAVYVPMVAVGIAAMLRTAGVSETDFRTLFVTSPFTAEPRQQFLPLVLQCLELVHDDEQPEAVVSGAWFAVCMAMRHSAPNAKAVWEAGGLAAIAASLRRFNPIEQVSQQSLIPSAAWGALKDLTESSALAGIDVVQPILQAGLVDAAVSAVTAYQMLNNPEAASPCSLCYGALQTLERLLATSEAPLIVAKLRSGGVGAVRYLIDNPLVVMAKTGTETGVQATRIAALVWGRDDDSGGLAFKQHDIDKLVEVSDHRHHFATRLPMQARWGEVLLSLCVSDTNKCLLLNADGFLSLLQDSLLLDPTHPRRSDGKTDFDAVCGPVRIRFIAT
jgi:hypothetical protein